MSNVNKVPIIVDIDMNQYHALVADQIALKQDFDAAMVGVDFDNPAAVFAALEQVFGPK